MSGRRDRQVGERRNITRLGAICGVIFFGAWLLFGLWLLPSA
jgi:hypothetical protein